MRRIGISPTASYSNALQTNISGGTHQVWTYDSQLSFSADADLDELIGIRGLSVYVGASWGAGGNLTDSLGSTIPTTGLYAPSLYLGEMYLQKRVAKSTLTILAGRLAAGNAFANLPVFNNYISYGINPNPYPLAANHATFSGPPPRTQWGAQVTSIVRPSIQIEAGVFNTNRNSANGANHVADFALQEGNKGALVIAEIDYMKDCFTEFVAQTPPLGLLQNLCPVEPLVLHLEEGNILVFVTDGFLEWEDMAGEEFGLARLESTVRAVRNLPSHFPYISSREAVCRRVAADRRSHGCCY